MITTLLFLFLSTEPTAKSPGASTPEVTPQEQITLLKLQVDELATKNAALEAQIRRIDGVGKLADAFFLALITIALMGSSVIPASYNLVQNAGSPLTRRSTLNCINGVTCADDGTNKVTTISTTAIGGNYSQSFTSQTTVILAHNLGTNNVLVSCYDTSTPPVQIIPNTTTIADTNDVTVTFSISQSGYCVVNGINASGGGGSTTSISAGVYASLPAAAVGNLYQTTNSIYSFIGVAGPAWQALFRGQAVTLPAPVSGFTFVNQSGATADDSKGSITVVATSTSGLNNAIMLVKSAPGTPYTATALMSAQAFTGSAFFDQIFGIVFRESGTGKLTTVQFESNHDRNSGIWEMGAIFWNSPTAPAAVVSTDFIVAPMNWIWVRAGDDGTNRFGEFSIDGITYVRFYQESRTNNMTADQVGFMGSAFQASGTGQFAFTLASWTLQ